MKEKAGVLKLHDFKLYYKTLIIKIVCQIHPHICGQLIFDKRSKNRQWGKGNLFINVGKTGQQHASNETRLLSYTVHKN